MRKLKILLSAFACEPDRGSEPGVGWNLAREMAKHHDVWVLTRSCHRAAIEAKLAHDPAPGLHFAYYEVPLWPQHWNYRDNKKAMELHYYLWQVMACHTARRLHQEVEFDVAQHVTFVRYWMPSVLAFLPIPFVWGPVGGGESAPKAFYKQLLHRRGRYFESLRDVARWVGENDPLVRLTARRSTIALATTRDTAARLNSLETRHVRVLGEIGLQREEVERLGDIPFPEEGPVRFISIGRLLHWKGFDLGLRAFAQAGLDQAEYWIVGDGPEGNYLQALAEELGIAERVVFWGFLPREETLRKMSESSVLVHPSLHDSGGWVCMEAMAARRPVLCLDLGGPAYQVVPEAGFKIVPGTPQQAVAEIAQAMRTLAHDPDLRMRMGKAGHQRVKELFTWESRVKVLVDIYCTAIDNEVGSAPSTADVVSIHGYARADAE